MVFHVSILDPVYDAPSGSSMNARRHELGNHGDDNGQRFVITITSGLNVRLLSSIALSRSSFPIDPLIITELLAIGPYLKQF